MDLFTSPEEITGVEKIGQTSADFTLLVNGVKLDGHKLDSAFLGKLEEVYPTEFAQAKELAEVPAVASDAVIKAKETIEKNRWFTSQSSQEPTQNMTQLRPLKKKVQRLTWCHL